jgi:Tol biopolymer transport system component/predicted Ser/Thr protein kinase
MERWQQIQSLFQGALERDPAERDAWLREACQGDSDLRREVSSLLANHQPVADSKPWAAAAAAKLIDGAASLDPGQCLGPYRIESFLAAGGMGKVYRATDTRLHREVAIKFSAARFTDRFEREARVIASLNHPNICQLYDVGPNYLVMEFVEGPTLAERIRQGAVPLEESLAIGRQITDALEAAHQRGIVHRDLKPGNVKVKPDGTVKVLDFGLAKMADPPEMGERTEDSPTVTLDSAATRTGVILGTAAYMCPEQVRGKQVDKRADIWAFGVVLYEMVTGQRLFEGETVSDTLIQVATKEPDWTRLPAVPGRNVRCLVRHCLEKDPKRRLRDIGEAWFVLEEVGQLSGLQPGAQFGGVRRWLAWGVAALFFAIAGLVSIIHFREKLAVPDLVRFQIPAPGNSDALVYPIISPDGRMIAFLPVARSAGRSPVWVRSLDSTEARPLPGTENFGGTPFWSPDSHFLAFVQGEALKKVDVSGGAPQTICGVPGAWRAGAWSRDGVIIFGSAGHGIMRVSASGGSASPVTSLNPSWQEGFHASPSFLPDGRHFIYYRDARTPGKRGIYVGSLDANPDQQRSSPLGITSGAHFVPSTDPDRGYLLFQQEDSVMAQPFDNRRLQLSGDAVLLARPLPNSYGPQQFSASDTGVLAYFTGGMSDVGQLTWFDRGGRKLQTVGEPGQHNSVVLSPDGTRAAVSGTEGATGSSSFDIWVYEFAHGTRERLTSDSSQHLMAVWSPDGRRLAYAIRRAGAYDLYEKASKGVGNENVVLKSDEPQYPYDWSPDGRFLLYGVPSAQHFNLWYLPVVGEDRQARPYLQTQFGNTQAQFSPDGHFVAYTADETGKNEIYVSPFPNASDERWVVSTNGGTQPRWRRDGRELFYLSADSKMMAVAVTTVPDFRRLGNPVALFEAPVSSGGLGFSVFHYDVSRDGPKFLIDAQAKDGASAPALPITVVLNWQLSLKK